MTLGKPKAVLVSALVLSSSVASADPSMPAAPTPPVIQIGSAYIAKQMCSCLFVAHRTDASCRPEFKSQGISAFTLVIDRSGLPGHAAVTASLGKLVAEARYTRRFGCTIAR